MPSKSSGPPDEGRRSTQVAGPTEVAVCEGVGIRYPAYSEIFSSEYRQCFGPPSKVKRLENCAAQESSKSSPTCPETRCTYPEDVCEGNSGVRGYSVALRAVRRSCEQSTKCRR
jgi:hypothetical protein